MHSDDAERCVLDAMMAARESDTIDDIAAVIARSDFYRENHAVIYDAILGLRKDDAPTTPPAVTERLISTDVRAFDRLGGAAYIASIVRHDTTPAQGIYWARVVASHAVTRTAQTQAIRLLQVIESGDLESIHAEQQRLVDEWSARVVPANGPRAIELDAFLDQDEPEHDWLVDGLLERGDRLILTGGEGKGKSTLLRQLGVQLASGIHPFGGAPFQAVRVLRLDVENGETRERRSLRPLRIAAGRSYAGGMVVRSRVEGLDLTLDEDRNWLHQLAAEHDPDVIITGPAYKMHAGDPNDETGARIVAAQFDRLRKAHGCAILLEAHSPHASNGSKRPTRPYGASYWLRWPEFGLHLGDGGELTHWRGPRDERNWPALLRRGGAWPWTPVTRERDIAWARIKQMCIEAGDQLSERDLADALNLPKTTVHRTIGENADAWASLAFSQVNEGGPA
jgi:hypothetical protein